MNTLRVLFACIDIDRVAFYICTGRVPDPRDMAGAFVQMNDSNGLRAYLELRPTA
jgi:hypothetical protein